MGMSKADMELLKKQGFKVPDASVADLGPTAADESVIRKIIGGQAEYRASVKCGIYIDECNNVPGADCQQGNVLNSDEFPTMNEALADLAKAIRGALDEDDVINKWVIGKDGRIYCPKCAEELP